jgi:hypothetical protein
MYEYSPILKCAEGFLAEVVHICMAQDGVQRLIFCEHDDKISDSITSGNFLADK